MAAFVSAAAASAFTEAGFSFAVQAVKKIPPARINDKTLGFILYGLIVIVSFL
jgi:hypothetical protein